MDYIPLNCPLEHAAHNIKSPQIGEVEAGIPVSVRLPCPHKHIDEAVKRIKFTMDVFGNVMWEKCNKEDKTFYPELPIRSEGTPR